MTLIYTNATEAWEGLYKILKGQADGGFRIQGAYASGDVVGEMIAPSIVITDATQGVVKSGIRNMNMRYALGEFMWYLSGSNKLRDILPFSKFWANLSSDGETVNSAYGYRIMHKYGFDQWEYVKALLIADPYSRQAVIHIKDADNTPTKDTPCTLTLQFLIREGALHMITTMRSNDIWLGFPFDVFAFTSYQMKMAMELGVDVGEYTHNVGSLHLYEKDVKKGEQATQATNKGAKGK